MKKEYWAKQGAEPVIDSILLLEGGCFQKYVIRKSGLIYQLFSCPTFTVGKIPLWGEDVITIRI